MICPVTGGKATTFAPFWRMMPVRTVFHPSPDFTSRTPDFISFLLIAMPILRAENVSDLPRSIEIHPAGVLGFHFVTELPIRRSRVESCSSEAVTGLFRHREL